MEGKVFKSAFYYKVIYAFTLEDESHSGLIKIGDATLSTNLSIDKLTPNCRELNQAALNRIKSYTNTAGLTPKLLHTELAIRTIHSDDGITVKAFRDHEVHSVLKNSGIKNVKLGETTGKEWFEIDLETVKAAIEAVKNNVANLSGSQITKSTPIVFRPEQIEAIEKTCKQFKKSDKMLWNAKMRFGKTLSALEVVKRMGFGKTIIITHRPVVNAGWYEDFGKIFTDGDYIYGSKVNGYEVKDLLNQDKKFVYFASVQDLRGSSAVSGKFDKNNEVFETQWDLVIVDEAHEGTTTSLGDETVKAVVKEGSGTKFLALSGTPFNILSEYDKDSIYTWDYIMEQECKSEWDSLYFGDSNPYDELPELSIYTYDLGNILKNGKYTTYEDKAFNFSEFFRVWTGDFELDQAPMPSTAEIGDFIHEEDVKSFLNLMVKEDAKSCYPFSNEEYRDLFKHSLWMVPGVKEAKALKKLMMSHSVFGSGSFDIVNVAGNGDEEEKSEEALKKVKDAIKSANKLGTYTITLSCGKLTTGVTVKEWTAVFMLSGSYSTSAANYLQTIFRVQSPCNENGMIKEKGYVFDFAPDRTLKMVSAAVSVSGKAGKTSGGDKIILGKFLNFCPVIGISGSEMKEYNTNALLQQLKKAYADKVVRNGFDDSNLYNDALFSLSSVDIKKFDELKGIIGSSKAQVKQQDITVNDQGLTKEEYEEKEKLEKKKKKDLTPEEKARLEELKKAKKLRSDAISILRGISIRMPLLIYGADIPYDEEITLSKFVELVDNSSWKEFMPIGVTKRMFKEFSKYYDEEVFISAGQRIRNIAKYADTLPPVERVKKIASLFANFKNPDKETVLTPWRVVNMHLSSALGGYDFFDGKHNDELDSPRYIDLGEITQETLGNKDAKILEINSKTGLYPLYVTYSLFMAKVNSFEGELTRDKEKELWEETVRNNVFVICKTPMAKQITQRTLMGYNNVKINAHYFDDLINAMKFKPTQFIDRVLKCNYWKIEGEKKMRFEAVVGNPPYQLTNEGDGTGADPIYHLFIDAARSISDKGTFIHPARFLFKAGKTPKEWNEKILNDEHFKVVQYWMNSIDVFSSVDVKGGIAVTYWDKNREFEKIGVFVPYEKLASALKKVLSFNEPSFSDIVYPRDLYRLNDSLYEENDWAENRQSKGHKYDVGTNVFEVFPELFTDDKPESDEEYARICGREKSQRVYKWVKKKYLNIPDNFDYYKIFFPKANSSGMLGEVLSSPIVASPNEGHTVTFLSIGKFETLEEAQAANKYIITKFARAMLGTLKVTQDNPKETWLHIPMQDFTSNSDIDWTKSISEIDKQLYKKYGLSEYEIRFIEEKIKPME